MRNRKLENADYSRLKRKVFLQACAMITAAVILVWLLYIFIWQDRMGDTIVSLLQGVLHDYNAAMNLYQQIFRNNAHFILVSSIAVMLFIIFRFFLGWFTKYFNVINRGIDELIREGPGEITLLPELTATEKKLNSVRQALEKRDMEAKLAEQRKNDLVVYLAHDIKTPLTSVIGYLSLLDEAPDMPAEQKTKYVHIALDKAYRLETMINEFFEITRYNLQQIHIEKKAVDLYYMLMQLTDEVTPILTANGNHIALHVDENISIYGDAEKLARVFNNILKNAAAYSYPNTEIVISAEERKNAAIISFKNEGGTIPAEKLATIFEKFYRMDEARASNTGGAGLGLAIAREIVVLHGGKITAQSERNTVVFTVTLPLSD